MPARVSKFDQRIKYLPIEDAHVQGTWISASKEDSGLAEFHEASELSPDN